MLAYSNKYSIDILFVKCCYVVKTYARVMFLQHKALCFAFINATILLQHKVGLGFYSMRRFADYINELREAGKYSFTLAHAKSHSGVSNTTIDQVIASMKKKKELVTAAQGFYIIVPPEYRCFGCVPEKDIVILLMEHLGCDYYIGGLSSAEYYGASHQKPNSTIVFSNKRFYKRLTLGDRCVSFIYKKDLSSLPTIRVPQMSGFVNIATPELTAMDLFLYSNKSAGLNHIATVFSELIEEIDIDKMIGFAKKMEGKYWVQRMGYILENIDSLVEEKQQHLIDRLHDYISSTDVVYTPIEPAVPFKGCKRNTKWKIIENATVESDL